MKIIIKIPKYIEKNVKNDLYKHIKSLCYLLSDDRITVSRTGKQK